MSAPRDAVIGAGIVGLALARALARRGRSVTVFESGREAQGASARNFGTLWPIGQPAGPRRALALESLNIWRDVLQNARAWYAPVGSLHVAYHDDEWQVLTEFAFQANAGGFACQMLTPAETVARQRLIRGEGLRGALWSPHELQVNPRQILVHVAQWLEQRWQVCFEAGTRVTSCGEGTVRAGKRTWAVDRVWLATGDDLQTLYPEAFEALGLRRCKLQMMRTTPVAWKLGPILAAGLTLGHYECFAQCPSLPALKARLMEEWPEQVAHGVHVLVAQHEAGHLVLGDSHEYDEAITPFDKPEVDQLVLDYLRTFLAADALDIVERWHGVYVKHPQDPYCVFSPEDGVTAVAALGGHGMTLSFGLAEQVVSELVDQEPAFLQEQQL
jgi:FAD dependent oxidoreductase TIGR03364